MDGPDDEIQLGRVIQQMLRPVKGQIRLAQLRAQPDGERSPYSRRASASSVWALSQSKSQRGWRLPQQMVSTWSVMQISSSPRATAASAMRAMDSRPSGEQSEWV